MRFKPASFLYPFILACFVLLSSCGKDEKPVDVSVPFNGMKARVDNKFWVAEDVKATVYTDKNTFVLTGSRSDGTKLSISFGSIKVGKLPIYGVTVSNATYLDSTSSKVRHYDTQVDEDAGGILEITSLNVVTQRASGRFKFNLRSIPDGKLMSVEDGEFTNIEFHIASPDDDTTVNNHAVFYGSFDYYGAAGLIHKSPNLENGVVRLIGSRILAEYKLSATETLRLEIEQHIKEGIEFDPGESNAHGAVQIITGGKVFQSESGFVLVSSYDTTLNKMVGNLNIKFAGDSLGHYYELDGDFNFTHPGN